MIKEMQLILSIWELEPLYLVSMRFVLRVGVKFILPKTTQLAGQFTKFLKPMRAQEVMYAGSVSIWLPLLLRAQAHGQKKAGQEQLISI